MKITDPEVIKNGEKDLIEAVKADLDLASVKELIKNRMATAELSSKGGEIVVFNNQIAFRLDFDVHLTGSLMFDRQGNYIPESDETSDLESFTAEDLDLDEINMTETLEEVGPAAGVSPSGDAEKESAEEEFDIDLPDYDLDDLDQLSDASDAEPETSEDDLIQDDLADEDMNDILKDSRDFWEQKK